MAGMQQGQYAAEYAMFIQQYFASQQPQWPQQHHFPYLAVPQSFQAKRSQQEFLRHQQQSRLLQTPLGQRRCSDSVVSVSTQCGDSSHCSSPARGFSTPTALEHPGAHAAVDTPAGPPEAAATGQPEAAPALQSKSAPARPLKSTPVTSNILKLSCTKEGCREVQEALESAPTDECRTALAAELHGHVIQAAKCINGNHVLQKCITTANPQSSQFIVDELCALGPRLIKIAKHKYGCRIFQRLLEHCRPAQLHVLIEIIMADALTLARHLYGTYVVQCIIEHGTRDQRHHLVALLVDHLEQMASDVHGSATLSVALCHAEEADGLRLARALLREPGMLASLARSRRGHTAVIHALDALHGSGESGLAIGELLNEANSLRLRRYGKLVVAHAISMADKTVQLQED